MESHDVYMVLSTVNGYFFFLPSFPIKKQESLYFQILSLGRTIFEDQEWIIANIHVLSEVISY